MPKVENVERQIQRIERFRAMFLYEKDRKNVRGDKIVSRGYPCKRALADGKTVEDWKETRFRAFYPGFEVEVRDGKDRPVQGNTKLATVRQSYEE